MPDRLFHCRPLEIEQVLVFFHAVHFRLVEQVFPAGLEVRSKRAWPTLPLSGRRAPIVIETT